MSFLRVWQFQVKPGQEKEFERIYGPAGDWAQLFRRASGFEGTELIRRADTPDVYITIDRWANESAFAKFKEKFASEYRLLDQACENLTESERNLGDFSSVG